MPRQRAADLYSKPQLSIPGEALAKPLNRDELETAGRKLAESYTMSPFSVLDARSGVWQERKRIYLSYGIQSELGRGQQITYAENGGEHVTEEGLNYYRNRSGKGIAAGANAQMAAPGADSGSPLPGPGYYPKKERGNARSDYGSGYSANFGAHKNDELGKFRTAAPGGQPRPATKRGADGHTVRGDGAGRQLYGTPGKGAIHSTGADYDVKEGPGRLKQAHHDNAEGTGSGPGSLHDKYLPTPGALPGSPGDTREPREPGKYEGGYAWIGGAGASRMGTAVGRDEKLVYSTSDWVKDLKGDDFTGLAAGSSGTSIFDPVLTELMYRWFCPANGVILDPYAGGSVRGIVAALWDFSYLGIDLRPEQIEANEAQKSVLCPDSKILWKQGDSRNLDAIVGNHEFDFSLQCPPYYNLEQYSWDPADLSNADSYDEFLEAYREISSLTVKHLKQDRFMAIVVGNFRRADGTMVDLVGDTIRAFQDAGASYYNDMVLLTAVGSLPIRVRNQMRASRKIGKTHQNCLVFVKGDHRKAAAACLRPEETDDAA